MNKKRRQRVRHAARLLDEARGIIDECKDEEYDSMSNLEGTALENTDRYQQMEEAYDLLDDVYSDLESVYDKLMEV